MKVSKSNKNPVCALVASAIVWGGGQLYNGQKLKAFIYFVFQILFFVSMGKVLPAVKGLITLGDTERIAKGRKIIEQGDNSIIMMIVGLIWLFFAIIFVGIYIANLRDAWKNAKLYNTKGQLLDGKKWFKNVNNKAFPYIVLVPTIIIVVLFVAIPIIFGFMIAFTNYSIPKHIPPKHLVDWVGLSNFMDIWKVPIWNSTFWGVLRWTLIWATVATFTCYFGGLLMAILINSKRVKCKKFWRTIYILPWAIPGMVSLLIFRNMFNGQFGAINMFLKDAGIISESIPWLTDPLLAKIVIFVVNFWIGFPYFMALMSGVMTSISPEIIEAAKIDGASPRQEFRHITLPLVLYQTAPLLIMSFSGNLNNFNIIFFLTEGNPVNSAYKFAGHTDILITWIYKLTRDNGQYAMASVMSIMVFAVVATISTISFLRTKSFKEEDLD